MTASRSLLLTKAGALAAALLFCAGAHGAADEPAAPPPVTDRPAFQAAADPSAGPPEAVEPVVVEQGGPLGLENALALALMHSPELQAFSWEARAGEARAVQAKRFPNPELNLRLYRLGIPRQNTELDEARRRVILSQVFELGGKRGSRVELAGAERDLAGWDYELQRAEVAGNVAARFHELLGAQIRADSTRRSVRFFEEMHGKIATLVETGALRSIEVHQSARQLALARIDFQAADAELSAARHRLAATWGSRLPLFSEAVGDLDRIPPLPPLDVVLELARSGPALSRWDSELQRSEAALALAKAERVPDLRTGAGVRWQNDFNERDYLVDFEIALPLFDRKKGEILEERYNVEKTLAEREAAEAQTAELVAELYFGLTACAGRAATLRDEVLPAARATFDAFLLGFDKDAAPPGDLFDARRDLTRAETDHAEALVECHQALGALETLIGRPLSGIE